MLRQEQVIFLAGFFDGEGCITIGKNGAVEIKIINTSLINLKLYSKVFGGEVHSRSQKVNKSQYYYAQYGVNAIEFLKEVQPYLLDKKEQANAALEYFELRNNTEILRIPGKRGRHANPDRQLLVDTFREILSELKKEEH
jgi:intein/homing endonuclease